MRRVTRFFVLVLGLSQFLSAQTTPENGCKYLDSKKPALYISYQGQRAVKDEKGKTTLATLLRLHNNSSCSISVETTDTSHNEVLNKREESRRPNGDLITRFIPNPPKDFELEIFYDVKESEGKAWKPGNYWQYRDISFSYPIPSGHSAAFPVQEKFFQKKWSVSVPFNYKWEAGPNSLYTISHRVFYFREFPKGFYVDDTQADYPAV